MNLDGLPPELNTSAWQATYSALDFTYPAEEFRDSNIRITSECSHGATWGALFRKWWPCCGVHSDVSVVHTSGTLDDLAVTIRAGLATHDDPCPNADRHAHEAQP